MHTNFSIYSCKTIGITFNHKNLNCQTLGESNKPFLSKITLTSLHPFDMIIINQLISGFYYSYSVILYQLRVIIDAAQFYVSLTYPFLPVFICD